MLGDCFCSVSFVCVVILVSVSSFIFSGFFSIYQTPETYLGPCKISVMEVFAQIALRKKCPYLELFWSAFSRIRTEYGDIRSISPYGEILRISPYSVRMRENVDQNDSEYGHFSGSVVND